MQSTPAFREKVKGEIMRDLMALESGDGYDFHGVSVECITSGNFKIDDIEGYGLFAATDVLADKHRQYCQ